MKFDNLKILGVQSMALVMGSPEEIERLKKCLTITSSGNRKFTLKLYKETGGKHTLKIPRGLINKKMDFAFDWSKIEGKSKIQLRPIQKEIINGYLGKLDTHPYGGIIKAPTGSGKTIIGIELMFKLGYRSLVVVPTDRIMTQWVEQVKAFSDIKDVGIIRQNKCDFRDKQVVVGMIHSLSQKKYPSDLYTYFGHVIFDEVHVLGAETFSRVAPMFFSRYRTGLSATPRRKDGMENVFKYHIGPVLSEYTKDTSEPSVIFIDYLDPASSDLGCVWSGELNIGRYYNKLASNTARNLMIARLVKAAYEKGYDILVLSDRIEQLKFIGSKLNSEDVGYCIGNKKEVNKKIILGTYGSAGLGLDIPRLSCLIFATPRTDVEQAVGRILRKTDSKKNPIVVDIIDSASRFMKMWSRKRLKYYKGKIRDINFVTFRDGEVIIDAKSQK